MIIFSTQLQTQKLIANMQSEFQGVWNGVNVIATTVEEKFALSKPQEVRAKTPCRAPFRNSYPGCSLTDIPRCTHQKNDI